MDSTGTDKPRATLGKTLRRMLHCPLCPPGVTRNPFDLMAKGMSAEDALRIGQVRVIAYRAKSIRVECCTCGMRFSIDPVNLADSVAGQAAVDDVELQNRASDLARENPAAFLDVLTNLKAQEERKLRAIRNGILGPHFKALETTESRSSYRGQFSKTKPR